MKLAIDHTRYVAGVMLWATCVIVAIALIALTVKAQCAPDDLICITTP